MDFPYEEGLIKRMLICMKDQSTLFTAKGIAVTHVSDKESTDKETRHKIVKGECQLIFISPEVLSLAAEWRPRMLSGD